jgi:hypothetical protein
MRGRSLLSPRTADRTVRCIYISEQLLSPSESRLRLSTQLGVEHVVLDNRGTELVSVSLCTACTRSRSTTSNGTA